jgi:pimeloyl-ACP methyl ester carboxylesterase
MTNRSSIERRSDLKNMSEAPPSTTELSEMECSNGSESCESPLAPNKTSLPANIEPAPEACPPPLMWQEILGRYETDSDAWEIHHERHRLVGRTWGEGPPLYLLNHFAGTAEMYSMLVWLLRDQFRCVVYDTFRSSAKSQQKRSLDVMSYSEDLLAVANHLGDRQFTVYGAGFGAAVAVQTALIKPDSVSRMILQQGFASRRLSVFERVLATLCGWSNGALDALPQRRRFQAVNHRPWFPPMDQSRFEFLIQSTGKIPLRDLAERAFAAHAFDIRNQLPKISCPVLLLRTEGEGRLAAQSQELLEQKVPNARTEWMHSAGQHPYLTHPHRVAKIVKLFCEGES